MLRKIFIVSAAIIAFGTGTIPPALAFRDGGGFHSGGGARHFEGGFRGGFERFHGGGFRDLRGGSFLFGYYPYLYECSPYYPTYYACY